MNRLLRTKSMKHFKLLPLCGLLALAGCSKSPSTGPGTGVVAPNRLTVTLTTRENLNADYYYGVAFDDNPNDGDGPRAIEGNTPIANGVMGGSFRLLVLYRRNVFEIWRRTDPTDPATERQILTSPFIGVPRASGNSIQFTLDLDARQPNGNFFFAHDANGQLAPDRLDINFATTNIILRNANDNRIKPVDAFETAAIGIPISDFDIRATRTTDIPDDPRDIRPGVDASFTTGPNQVNFGQLDVTNLRLQVERG